MSGEQIYLPDEMGLMACRGAMISYLDSIDERKFKTYCRGDGCNY